MRNITRRIEKLEKCFQVNQNVTTCPEITDDMTEKEVWAIYKCMLRQPKKIWSAKEIKESEEFVNSMSKEELEEYYYKHIKNLAILKK